jgi:hypothetical protein
VDWTEHDNNVDIKNDSSRTKSSREKPINKKLKKINGQNRNNNNFYGLLTDYDDFEPPRMPPNRPQHHHRQPMRVTRRERP